jgi:tripartite ATP-independent transporter DctM subunit
VAAGGTLGVLIPPSGILVVYAIATEVSLVDLFIAALVPGFLTAGVYALMIYALAKFGPSFAVPVQRRQPIRVQIRAAAASWEILGLFGVVMGSIYLGIATPTEAATVGAVGATLLVLRQKRNRLSKIREGLLETGSVTAAIFFLILGAGLFSMALATTQIPVMLADWAVGLSDNRLIVLILILIPYFLLGMFIDGISMILLTMPIVFPIILKLGFDPVWFGILVTKTVEVGLLTPPVGLNAFVVKNVAPEIPMLDIFRGCVPFVIAEIGIIALLIVFPEIVWYDR